MLVYDRGGKPLWVSVMANSVFDERGSLVNIVDVLTDITPTKVHEVLQRRVLQAMVNEASVVEVMNMVCREVERLAPEVAASVVRVDDAGLLRPLAAPSLPQAYSDALEGVAIGPQVGACGTSAFLGRPVIVPDIATDPLWDDYRHLPLPEEYKACWSSPIKSSDGRVIGTFAFYFRERRLPDDFHHRLVDVCVYLCALALEREEARARIRQLAFYDELTGLPNRNLLLAQAEQAIARAEPERKRVAVLFLDLDRFKQVNDTLGHPIGDALLRDVAQRLRRLARATDIVGRLSGDEFVMLMPEFEHGRLTAAAEHILVALAQPGPWRRRTVELGHYVGVVDGERLLAMAGQRMRPAGHVEISAVCTHPDAWGRGYGEAVTRAVTGAALDAGDVAFLHVAEGNDRARLLYERLGFRLRRRMAFTTVAPPEA